MFKLALAITIFSVSLAINAGTELASATPRSYKEALREANQLKRIRKRFARKLTTLSASEKAKLKRRFKGSDSDSDGVADEIELGLNTGLCETDSDNDGIDDGNDDHENEDDHNNDGQPDGEDGQEFEVKGEIESFSDPILVVNGREFTLTGRTEFRGRGFDRGDLRTSLCVEVNGRIEGDLSLVDSIKADDDC
jgi:hypothetical protein